MKCGDGSRLTEELKRLQNLLSDGHELKVIWTPKQNYDLDGEVKGNTIHIYSESLEQALKTLHHEFLDVMMSEIIEPYKQVANSLVLIVNKQAYGRKEKLLEKLANLLS